MTNYSREVMLFLCTEAREATLAGQDAADQRFRLQIFRAWRVNQRPIRLVLGT